MTYHNSSNAASDCSSLTVLHAPGKRLTKAFAKDATGAVVKRDYDGAATFHTYQAKFVGLDGFAERLRQLRDQPECCVIRGVPGKWHPGPEHRVLRRLHPAEELAEGDGPNPRFRKPEGTEGEREALAAGRLREVTVLPMFEDGSVDWVLLDFEKIEHPALGAGWRADLPAAATFLRAQLPPAFHDAGCVYYATSSAADLSKPDWEKSADIRMRLGFLLSRPIASATAKRWLAGAKGLDPSTLQAVQQTYTARSQQSCHRPPFRAVRLG